MTGPGTLLLVSHAAVLVSAVLLPPTSVTISSRNFQHILTWDDPNNESVIYYNVGYRAFSNTVINGQSCSNITSRQCDLTRDFSEIMSEYRACVWSFTRHEKSPTVYSKIFVPVLNTLLGPAEVDVAPCDYCITVSVQLPVSHVWSEQEQRNVSMLDIYPMLSYSIYWANTKVQVQPEDYFYLRNSTDIKGLQPNTNYCVSVRLSASQNIVTHIDSEPKCVITGPTPQLVGVTIIVLGVVLGLLLLCGIVLPLILLDKAGYICMRRKFFPKVLKSFPESESRFSRIDGYAAPTSIDCAKIMEYRVEVMEKQENEIKDHEGGYANRKKLMDSGTSVEASSGPDPSFTSSSGTSGGVTSSSGEEEVTTGHPTNLPSDSDGSGCSGTPLLAHTIDPSSDLQFNNSGVFNINLNSVSIASPADVWTDLTPGRAMAEEPDTAKDSGPTRLSLNGDSFLCPPIGLGLLEPTAIDVEYCNSEEDLSDNCEDGDSDDHPVSGYMQR